MRVIFIGRTNGNKRLEIDEAYVANGFCNGECNYRNRGRVIKDWLGLPEDCPIVKERILLQFLASDECNCEVAVYVDTKNDNFKVVPKTAVNGNTYYELEAVNRQFDSGNGMMFEVKIPMSQAVTDYINNSFLKGEFKISLGDGTTVYTVGEYLSYLNTQAGNDFEADPAGMLRMNFVGDDFPTAADYSVRHLQAFYLCKYSYAYIYMYFKMYSDIIKDFSGRYPFIGVLSTVSLGCGANLDGFGMKMAAYLHGIGENEIQYTGVDYSHWDDHGFEVRVCDNHRSFYGVDVRDFLRDYRDEQGMERLGSDVVIFPYSVSEFYQQNDAATGINLLQEIAERLRVLIKRDTYIAFNIREDEDSEAKDNEAMDFFMNILRSGDISRTEVIARYNDGNETPETTERGIAFEREDYVYPDDVMDRLCRISTDTGGLIRSKPMFGLKYIKYRIYLYRPER